MPVEQDETRSRRPRRQPTPPPLKPGEQGPLLPGQKRQAGPVTTYTPPPAKPSGKTRSTSRGGATSRGSSTTGTTTPAAPTSTTPATQPQNLDLAKKTYGYMAWALDHAELGPILQQAATDGLGPNELRGKIYGTTWFKEHGTANVAEQLQRQNRQFAVAMGDTDLRGWAFKIITGEVMPAEYRKMLVEKAKGRFPTLADALDRGITVEEYAADYKAIVAKELGVSADSINIDDPKWARFLDHRDKDGKPTVMTQWEWQQTVRRDPVYGWDNTPGARQLAADFSTRLAETFGGVG